MKPNLLTDIEIFELFSRHHRHPPDTYTNIDSLDRFSSIIEGIAQASKAGPPSKRGEYEYNFVYEIHDGAIIVTKQKFTQEEFEKFVAEINIEKWEAIEFTGTKRI